MNKTLIIAEAGVNHNGNLNLAFKLIDIAAKSKADYVKFKTYSTENLVQKKTKGIKKINSLEKRKLVNCLYKYGFDLDKINDVIFEF